MALPPHKPPQYAAHILRVALKGHALLSSPRLNKGSAFPLRERHALGLVGRLPYRPNTIDEQCARVYAQLQDRETPLRKNTFLQSVKDQNWTLYYALLARHLKELVPIIYTPTEAEAIANYSHLFRRAEGLYLSFPNYDTMEEDFLEQTRGRDIDLIVCTDAEAILGIGDQGVGGIGISTAKSVIYTLIGGLDPARSIAVVLDVGTNNKTLLDDPLYVGWQEKRVSGKEYDRFVDRFVQIVRKHYPHSLLHFEDFGVRNAHRILDRYHDTHAVFNDDIQGTGAVTLACIMAAIGVSRRARAASKAISTNSITNNRLADQRYLIFGGGSAGMGIAVQLRDAMMAADGVSRTEANGRFWIVDREGLLVHPEQEDEAKVDWSDGRREFWRPAGDGKSLTGGTVKDLTSIVKHAKPTVMIGCSTAAGAFTESAIKAMVAGLDADEETKGTKPIILPLSNPSRLVEAEPSDLMEWTDGRALVATGSPFGTVEKGGIGFEIAECNNALIYPGLGFGAILAQARCMTDTMLLAGAKRLAALSPAIVSAKGGRTDAASPGDSTEDLSEGIKGQARGDTESNTDPQGIVGEKDLGESQETSTSDNTSGETYEYKGESLLPDFGDAPTVNFEVALAVAEQAVREGSANSDTVKAWGFEGVDWNKEENAVGSETGDKLKKVIREKAGHKVWVPVYYDYEYDEDGLREL